MIKLMMKCDCCSMLNVKYVNKLSVYDSLSPSNIPTLKLQQKIVTLNNKVVKSVGCILSCGSCRIIFNCHGKCNLFTGMFSFNTAC